jgi:hypothetical protein
MYEEQSDEYMDEQQDEYMYEEQSDEYMDDRTTITYMSRANAMCANNMSATNMCAVL